MPFSAARRPTVAWEAVLGDVAPSPVEAPGASSGLLDGFTGFDSRHVVEFQAVGESLTRAGHSIPAGVGVVFVADWAAWLVTTCRGVSCPCGPSRRSAAFLFRCFLGLRAGLCESFQFSHPGSFWCLIETSF